MSAKDYKVALIHNVIAPYRVSLFDELASRDDITLEVYYCTKKNIKRNWTVNNINHKYTILKKGSFFYKGIDYHANIGILRHLDSSIDCIVITNTKDATMQLSYLYAQINQIPIILWSEASDHVSSHLSYLYEPINKHIIRSCDSIIVPGEPAERFNIRRGADPTKIFEAPNTIDYKRYHQMHTNLTNNQGYKIKDEYGLNTDYTFLYVGQLIERKGVNELVSAFNMLPEQLSAGLLIAGSGPLEKNLHKYLENNNNDNVKLIGYVSEEEKLRLYANCDCFILPSREDTAPIVINEALAMGLPIISTYGIGSAKQLARPHGLLVPIGSDVELCNAVIKVTDQYDQFKSLGEKGFNFVHEKVNNEKVASTFASAIEYTTNAST